MKLADAHIHLFRGGYPGRYGALFPRGGELSMYESIRTEHDIDRALVIGYEGQPWSRGNNRYLARLLKQHRWMAPLAFYDCNRKPSPGQFPTWWAQGFLGISLYVSTAPEACTLLKWPEEHIDALNAKRAIISVNCAPPIAEMLRPIFARLHNTRILISHLGLPGPMPLAIKNLIPLRSLAGLPHLGVKLSGPYACNSYPHPGLPVLLRALFDAYGDSRLYWGSDFSPALDTVTFDQTIEAIRIHLWANPRKIFSQNLKSALRRVQRHS